MSYGGILGTPNTSKTQFGGLQLNSCVRSVLTGAGGREAFNHKSQSSILGGIRVSSFISDLGEETDGMLIKFLGSTSLERRSKPGSKKISTGRNDGPNVIDSTQL